MAESPPPSEPRLALRSRRALVAALTAVAVAVLAIFLLYNRVYIASHYAPRPGLFFAIAALVVLTLAARSASHQVLFNRLGMHASAGLWFRLVTVSSFTNYLPLSAGMVAKAYYLKRVHAMPFGIFALGQVVMFVMIVATNGLVGLATLAVGMSDHLYSVIGAGFAVMSSAGAPFLLPDALLRRLGGRWLPADGEALPLLRRAAPAFAVLQIVNLLATAGTLEIAFAMGSSQVGFAACLVFSAAAMLTRLVAITPGAIGVREFLIGGLAYLTGFDVRDAVIASTATRTVEIVVVFALGGIFTRGLSDEVIATYGDTPEA